MVDREEPLSPLTLTAGEHGLPGPKLPSQKRSPTIIQERRRSAPSLCTAAGVRLCPRPLAIDGPAAAADTKPSDLDFTC